MFKYNYVPANELDDKPIKMQLKAGKAHFVVKAFYDKDREGHPLKTLGGDPKINVLMEVTDSQNSKSTIYDTITSNMPWKVKALADSLAMPGIYNSSGMLDFSKLIGYEGECWLKNEASDKHGTRTVIDKYLPHASGAQQADPDDFLDDEVPF
jgi:hypothetical protein